MRRMILALGSLLVLSGVSTVGAQVAPAPSESHDGAWRVTMVTDRGICDPTYEYRIMIDEGSISLIPEPDQAPMQLSGEVVEGGGVNVRIRRGLARVAAAGELARRDGGGTWRLPLLGCEGRWSARRGGGRTVAN